MTQAEGGLLLASGRLANGDTVDVLVRGATIEAVGPPGTLAGADSTIDLYGYLLLPAPAEPHCHLDSALLAERVPNPKGDLLTAIEGMKAAYREGKVAGDIAQRATRGALQGLANGTTAIRTHVEIYHETGLTAVEKLLEVREALRGTVDLQVVALTTSVTGPENAEVRAYLRTALEMGVDVVGGCPHLDADAAANHDLVLELAAEFGRQIDVHTDEELDAGVLYLPDLADKVIASGFPHQVSAGHCVSLGLQPPEVATRVAARVAEAGIAVICNPQTNLYLQARGVTTAPARGLTAVRALLDAGATVAGGGDNLRDPFNAVGRADPLETASLLVTAGHLTPMEAYEAVSAGARAAMGLPEVRVEPGRPAELLAVDADSVGEAVAGGTSRIVIHRGREVSRTTVSRSFPGLSADALAAITC